MKLRWRSTYICIGEESLAIRLGEEGHDEVLVSSSHGRHDENVDERGLGRCL